MDIFSLFFISVWLVSLLLYYCINKSNQWAVLLCSSVLLYIVSVHSFPIVLFIITGLTYGASTYIYMHKGRKSTPDYKLRIIRNLVIALCVAVLFIGRQSSIFATLGNSYFTLKAIGYLIDCERYDDKEYYENNILFFLLYLIFFPTIAQGPFNRYKDFKKQFVSDYIKFDYVRVMHGIQRFLWGAFKKLVIAPRFADISGLVFSDITGKSGLTIVIGVMAETMYYYMDFSSYMDMMIGISSSFGIDIPENFRQPFLSTSVAEFWRRWHITLGGWFKDYIMMPFVQSKLGRNLKKIFKKHGKDISRNVPLVLGTFFVWSATYLWHGTNLVYFLWAMYYCSIITLSLVFEKEFKKLKEELSIDDKTLWYQIFARIRTYILVLIANLILCVNRLSDISYVFRQLIGKSFLVGEGMTLGVLEWRKLDVVILVITTVIVLTVSIIKEKGKNVFTIVDRWILPARWAVYYALIFTILIFGRYGSGYDTSEFMYTNF